MKINDGGPAFPIQIQTGDYYKGEGSADGMSLRDYFAAKAMAILLESYTSTVHGQAMARKNIGADAYAIADAMLAARIIPVE
jgi:hypothetical protein